MHSLIKLQIALKVWPWLPDASYLSCSWFYCWGLQRDCTRKLCFSGMLYKNVVSLKGEKGKGNNNVEWTSRDPGQRSKCSITLRPAAQRAKMIFIHIKVIGNWNLLNNKSNLICSWWLVRSNSTLKFQTKVKMYWTSCLLKCFFLLSKQFKLQKG